MVKKEGHNLNEGKYDIRSGDGSFVSNFTDEEIWSVFQGDPSTKRCAEHFSMSRRQMRERLARIRRRLGSEGVTGDPGREGKLEQLIASVPLSGPEGSNLEAVDVKLWGVAAKNDAGEIVTKGLDGIMARYKVAHGKRLPYPPVQPYYVVEPHTYVPLPEPKNTDLKRVFIIGDVQIGYWRKPDGGLIPFHDESAIDLTLQMLARYRPQHVVILGDALDLPEFSRFRQEPAFRNTTNPAIARLTVFLAEIRAIVGEKCEISYIMGNHELRITASIVDKLDALYGLRRYDAPEKWGVLTIPFLLQFERHNIRCTDQYPSGEVWLTDQLVCTHAPDKNLAATVICGHLIKATTDSHTRYYHDGPRVYETLVVPGLGNYRGKPEDKFRITRNNIPSDNRFARTSAQQAVATVDITKDGRRYNFQRWNIEDGESFFREFGLMRGVAKPWEYVELAA